MDSVSSVRRPAQPNAGRRGRVRVRRASAAARGIRDRLPQEPLAAGLPFPAARVAR